MSAENLPEPLLLRGRWVRDVPFDAACRVFGHRVLIVEFEQDGVVFIGKP